MAHVDFFKEVMKMKSVHQPRSNRGGGIYNKVNLNLFQYYLCYMVFTSGRNMTFFQNATNVHCFMGCALRPFMGCALRDSAHSVLLVLGRIKFCFPGIEV